MTFAAVTKNIKSITVAVILKGSSFATKQKQCHSEYKKGYTGKKGECGTLSCKNDHRHPYDKRNTDTTVMKMVPEQRT